MVAKILFSVIVTIYLLKYIYSVLNISAVRIFLKVDDEIKCNQYVCVCVCV